jgi:hypothetical protein
MDRAGFRPFLLARFCGKTQLLKAPESKLSARFSKEQLRTNAAILLLKIEIFHPNFARILPAKLC